MYFGERTRDKIFRRSAHIPWNFNQLKKIRHTSYICRRTEKFQLNLKFYLPLFHKGRNMFDSVFVTQKIWGYVILWGYFKFLNLKILVKTGQNAVPGLLEMEVTRRVNYKKGQFLLIFLKIFSSIPFSWNFQESSRHSLKFH